MLSKIIINSTILFSINNFLLSLYQYIAFFFLKFIADNNKQTTTAFIHTFHISFYSNRIIDIYCILKSKTPYYTFLIIFAVVFSYKVT